MQEEPYRQHMSNCKEIKTCNKRHQKSFKPFVMEIFCKFGRDCAYLHIASEYNGESNDII